eukprot:1161743-Pelagomonas_calceolata.AAC.5
MGIRKTTCLVIEASRQPQKLCKAAGHGVSRVEWVGVGKIASAIRKAEQTMAGSQECPPPPKWKNCTGCRSNPYIHDGGFPQN